MLELGFSSKHGRLESELWSAILKQLEFDDDDAPTGETVLATASMVRLYLSGSWIDSLDGESGDLEAIDSALLDRERLSLVEEESLFADSLLVIDWSRSARHIVGLARAAGWCAVSSATTSWRSRWRRLPEETPTGRSKTT